MKRLTYLRVAEIELVEAAQYYDGCEPGLGRKFLDAVTEATEKFVAGRNNGRFTKSQFAVIASCRFRIGCYIENCMIEFKLSRCSI